MGHYGCPNDDDDDCVHKIQAFSGMINITVLPELRFVYCSKVHFCESCKSGEKHV